MWLLIASEMPSPQPTAMAAYTTQTSHRPQQQYSPRFRRDASQNTPHSRSMGGGGGGSGSARSDGMDGSSSRWCSDSDTTLALARTSTVAGPDSFCAALAEAESIAEAETRRDDRSDGVRHVLALSTGCLMYCDEHEAALSAYRTRTVSAE